MRPIEHYTHIARDLGLTADSLLALEFHDIPRHDGWSIFPYDNDELLMIGYRKSGGEFVAYFFNGKRMKPFEEEGLRIRHFSRGCTNYCFKVDG